MSACTIPTDDAPVPLLQAERPLAEESPAVQRLVMRLMQTQAHLQTRVVVLEHENATLRERLLDLEGDDEA